MKIIYEVLDTQESVCVGGYTRVCVYTRVVKQNKGRKTKQGKRKRKEGGKEGKKINKKYFIFYFPKLTPKNTPKNQNFPKVKTATVFSDYPFQICSSLVIRVISDFLYLH